MLVNNAAILYDTWQRGIDADLDQVREAFETNLLGAWRVTQAVLPLLRASPAGRIVNVSSGAGALHDMGGGTPAYRTSKAALNALTRVLAAELRGDADPRQRGLPRLGGDRHGRRRAGGPVAEGAAGIVWAATLPDDGPTAGSSATGARSTGAGPQARALSRHRDRLHLDEHVEEQAGLDGRARRAVVAERLHPRLVVGPEVRRGR